MAQTLKRISAGSLQLVTQYRRINPSDTPVQRAEKKKASSAAQARMNKIYSYQKLERQLATNYPIPGSGLVGTATFENGHLPKTRKQAQAFFYYFLEKLRIAREKSSLPPPVVHWALEILTSENGRWHVHFVIDNTGNDLEMIKNCWIYGDVVELNKLRVDDEKNHETLARYMTKELRECQEYDSKPGLHSWSCTKNAKKPEIETITVPDDYVIVPPEGCTILLDENKQTEWASYRVLKYRINSRNFDPAPRAKRRKRKPV